MESSRKPQINTANDCGVSIGRDHIMILAPLRILKKEEARRFAAWLVALSDALPGEAPEFGDILEAVQDT